MKRILFLAAVMLWVAPAPGLAQTLTKAEAKARYAQAEALRQGEVWTQSGLIAGPYDPDQAFTLMHDLAQAGDLRATERLGYYYARGIGTAPSPAMAEASIQAAIDGGRDQAHVAMAKLWAEAGRVNDAEDRFALAQSMQLRAVTYNRLNMAARGYLGPAAQARSFVDIGALADDGDPNAQGLALWMLARGHGVPLDIERTVAATLHRARNESPKQAGRAAEALLAYLAAKHPDHDFALQAELAAHPFIRGKIRTEHGLRLAARTQAHRFWTASEQIMAQAPASSFARGLSLTRRHSRNAAVRIVQLELADMGYRPGRVSGYLTRPTIRAINQFCRDAGIWDTCKLGPAKSTTMKALGLAIAARKTS